MGSLFGFLAKPLGWLMWVVYEYVGFHNYFLTIFIFTFLMRLIMFPLSIKNQKSAVDRARLAPRLERIQKKYANDRQKLQQKQQELYEKENVSMTGGCLPLAVQMIVLFGIIAVIYSPLNYLVQMDTRVIDAAVSAVTVVGDEDPAATHKITENEASDKSYYREMKMLNVVEYHKDAILQNIQAIDGGKAYDAAAANAQYDQLIATRNDFSIGGYSLLENPWRGGFSDISLLWLLPLLSGLSAFVSSWLSMRYNKASQSEEMQQVQGCTGGMMYVMPLFSLVLTFTVPGGVGVYWICSNLIALLQTVVLNKMYNPAKARAQAEIEYQERRRRKAEDKKRLAEARQKEAQEKAAFAPAPQKGKKPSKSKAKTTSDHPAATDSGTDAEERIDQE